MSQFKLQDMTPDDITKLVKNGIGSQLEDLIYAELKVQAEATARKVAKEIADRLAAQVNCYKSTMDFTTRVDLTFNMADENSNAIGRVVEVRDGVPVVAWSSDLRDLAGKVIFST
jgi:predicted DNA binding protein